MGASSSSENNKSEEEREVENQAASTGALPLLQNAFHKLADPLTNSLPLASLQRCFLLNFANPICDGLAMPDNFPQLLNHLGPSIVDQFFVLEKGGVTWIEFVRGYVKCCGRMPVSMLLNTLLRVYNSVLIKAGLPSKLVFESGDADCKISGSLMPTDVIVLLWMCWTMLWDSRTVKQPQGERRLRLPDVELLVLSAVVSSCPELASGIDAWDCKISGLDVQIPVGKFVTWALATVPNLPDCFTQFVNARLQSSIASKENLGSSSSSPSDVSDDHCDNLLLTHGRAWAISLTIKDNMQEEILKTCFPVNGRTDENLLYRSSLHGRGLNRLWSNVEGYHGPTLVLVSASSENDKGRRQWIIGVLIQQEFESKDQFYGSPGNLYAISPIFHVYSPHGRDKNFVYSHLHPKMRAYEAHPKPVGIAFGGTTGNERIYIGEDFAKITIRHHAVDKTYKPGLLFPSQGYPAVEASILEVEVWGLGGSRAKEVQGSYKKREEIFSEQRRKVDLKTFGNWEDSPEKMMMDMVSNPSAARREKR